MMSREKAEELLATLKQAAPHMHDEIAAIGEIIAKARAVGQTEGLPITGSIGLKLEKFDGEYEPGKLPVETINSNHSW